MTPAGWTDERVAQLRALWLEGLSCSLIAAALGGGLSRNAVIGKIHRLRLPARIVLTRRDRPSPGRKEPPRRQARRPWSPPPRPAPAPGARPVTIRELERLHCRWIDDDVEDADVLYCGAPRQPGSPYCPVHARRAVLPDPMTER